MVITRRSILKGLTLLGAASSWGSLGLAASFTSSNNIKSNVGCVVVEDSIVGHRFLSGVQIEKLNVPPTVLFASPTLGFIKKIQKFLRHDTSEILLGLVDNASATLIIDIARSEGAKVQIDHYYKLSSDNTAIKLGALMMNKNVSLKNKVSSPLSHNDYVVLRIETVGGAR